MLRRRVPKKKIFLKPDEKARLVKLGESLGPAVRQLISIVHYTTYRRWVRAAQKDSTPTNKRGRPRTAQQIRELILRLARETGWGYTRVMGEMKKMGIPVPSRNTVKNIMKENDLDPGPKRGCGSWSEFLKVHADTLWQCDFFSKKIWTSMGLRQHFVLVFLHVGTRRVFVTTASDKPDTPWMKQQAKRFLRFAADEGITVDTIMRDRDNMFIQDYDQTLTDSGARVVKTAVRAPNQNAFVERWVQSIKQECLDHFIVFGEDHFNHLISEYVEHYHTERPHQGLDNRLLIGKSHSEIREDEVVAGEVHCRTRLGGMLRHYYRAAA